MPRIPNLLAAGLLAAGGTLAAMPLTAQAANCPTSESYFGTIERVQGNTLTVRQNNGQWGTVIINSAARMNTNGYALRPGTYVGLYGCVTPNGVFHASEVTLARDQSLYNETVSGIVRRVENGRILVSEPAHRTTGWWFTPDADEYQVGQTVTGTGMVGVHGGFYPERINGRVVAADSDMGAATAANTRTLQGEVRRVMPGRLIVWEPAYHTTGTWVVNNATSFRVGQMVRGTGTEHNGVFYPTSIGPG
jgi:hypothetical protein